MNIHGHQAVKDKKLQPKTKITFFPLHDNDGEGSKGATLLSCVLRVLQCAAVCCGVLQCVGAPLLSCVLRVLQCAAVCCGVLQCVAVCCSVLQCAAVWYNVLQYAAVCCSVLQCVAVRRLTSCAFTLCVCVRERVCVCARGTEIEGSRGASLL